MSAGRANDDFDSSKFGWIEYVAFCSLLTVSTLIGIYYGCIKGKQNTVTEYMLGGKTMSIFPIAMSLLASHVSGVTLLGVPSEVYEFGTQYAVQLVAVVLLVYVTNKFYLPVFFELQLCSVYEYLEMRFSRTVRKLCSFIFATTMICYIPIVIYTPALALRQVSGISVHVISPIICVICIFYTAIGGLKAVVWTDTVQGIFTIGVTIVVSVIGVVSVGGVEEVYNANVRGDRLELFNFNVNPYQRISFWTTTIGVFFMWIVALSVHPGSTQRFVALPTMRAAQWSVVWFGAGITILVSLSTVVGTIIYARYENCDPIKMNYIEKSGQLLPYYVQEVASAYPGLTGLFISGLISSALGTMSAGLNTCAGTVYEDFMENLMPKYTTEGIASLVMKIIVVIFGILCILLVYVVERLGDIVPMSYALTSCQNGAIFSVFALGLFFPWANSKGVICGMISSLVCSVWITFKAQTAIMQHDLVFIGLNTSIQGCSENFSIASVHPTPASFYTTNLNEVAQGVFIDEDLNPIYAISFLYYAPVGAFIGVIVGIIISLSTGGSNLNDLNPKLITPPLRRFLPKFEDTKLHDYKTFDMKKGTRLSISGEDNM